jgi:hypothetical protein
MIMSYVAAMNLEYALCQCVYERVTGTTLNGRPSRKLLGLLHPAIPSRVSTAGIRKRDYYLVFDARSM